jgi:hypothetical protein
MERRSFLKIVGAMTVGFALRPVPVLGQNYSELVAPTTVYPSASPPPIHPKRMKPVRRMSHAEDALRYQLGDGHTVHIRGTWDDMGPKV